MNGEMKRLGAVHNGEDMAWGGTILRGGIVGGSARWEETQRGGHRNDLAEKDPRASCAERMPHGMEFCALRWQEAPLRASF